MWSTRTVTAFSTPQSLAYLSNAVSYAGMKWLHTKMRSDDPRIWAGAAPAFHGVTSCDAAAPAIPAPAAVRSPRRVRVRADFNGPTDRVRKPGRLTRARHLSTPYDGVQDWVLRTGCVVGSARFAPTPRDSCPSPKIQRRGAGLTRPSGRDGGPG